MAEKLGIEVKKADDPNAWFTEIINKSEMIEYTDVSGCYILRPKSQHIWDTIHDFIDTRIKRRGVKNCSFPLFIPESLLLKEQEHVEGFAPEVAWVTHSGETKLAERLAVRPTSETIMYAAYAKWIRNYKDLPLKLNQWNNVVRWEFKHPQPFLRSREFYWQEGHTAFATEAEAREEAMDILMNVYRPTYEELLAIPVLVGAKTEREKFAGAVQSLSCEVFLPIGKAIQGCTSHYLGTNFAKAFGIEYVGQDQQKHFAHQNSWGFTTRSIGVAIMMHSDDKGLVLPPPVADHKVIIVPVFQKDNNEDVLTAAKEISHELKGFDPLIDDRIGYTLGWRMNDAELRGYPLRIELGNRELEAGIVTLVRRDTLQKMQVKREELRETVKEQLEAMQRALYLKAKAHLDASIVEEYSSLENIQKQVEAGKLIKTAYFSDSTTDDIIREKTAGKTLCSPFEDLTKDYVCPFTGKPATHYVYIAKSL